MYGCYCSPQTIFNMTSHTKVSLDTFVCTFASEYNTKFFGKIHRGFGIAFSQLENMFYN